MKELIVSPVYNEKGNIIGQEYHGELIRCYECKHFNTDLSDPNESPWCYEGIVDPGFHEFCSRAERKDND